MTTPRYDIVIFGATGFTGKHTIPQVWKLSRENERKYTWAVAGRSEDKLRNVLLDVGGTLGEDLSGTPIIVADVNDPNALDEMAKRARVIVNTCGPYSHYGEGVIRACIENGCHHVDVSGEPFFIEDMQLRYHKQAQEKGVYIISACGYDSIPADLGLIFMQSEFEGTLNSVEVYHSFEEANGPHPGAAINYGTWASVVEGINAAASLKELRAKLYPNKLPKFTPKLSFCRTIHSAPFDNSWAVPFLGSDHSVCHRTQRFLYEEEKRRPIQLSVYCCFKNIFAVIALMLLGAVFMILAKFEGGRKVLLAYPGLFTAGYITREGPSVEKMKNTMFTLHLFGNGWSEKKDDCNEEFTTEPDKKMTVRISGTNPGYGATVVMLTASAVAILDNLKTDKLPKKGGVYSPGAAFAHTSIIKELTGNGIKFEVLPAK